MTNQNYEAGLEQPGYASMLRVWNAFTRHFETSPTLIARSPGRINLIGEHTDYNKGFVLPAAIDKQVFVAIRKREDMQLRYLAVDLEDQYQGALSDLARSPKLWPDYLNGVVDQFLKKGLTLTGLDIAIGGDIPSGAGLSSSAAIECATAFALNKLFHFELDRLEMVKLAQAAENQFVGVNCGIMDQFASMFGVADHAIMLDCKTLKYEYVPLNLRQNVILLLDTGVKHSLASGEYNLRRKQCEEGVKALQQVYPQVESLRDVNRAMIEYNLKGMVSEMIYNRCKYVVEENLRLQVGCEALRRNDLSFFGKRMFASHQGLSKLYEVSCPELDYLVELARNEPSVLGARMMGGGFGGCTINIVKRTALDEVIHNISKAYMDRFGQVPAAHICSISEGTSLVKPPSAKLEAEPKKEGIKKK